MAALLAVSSFASPAVQLLLIVAAACLAPLLIIIPVHYRGRARERAGKPPGWEGPGWSLAHLWLGFAWLVIAQVLVVQFVVPGAIDRFLSGGPASGIQLATDGSLTADQVLWTMTAVASCLLVILPGAPLRLLWTTRWSVGKALFAAWLAFLALKLATLLLVPSLPEITSEQHPQHELTESLSLLSEERSVWLTLLVVAVIAPLVEEVLFRGVMLTALARRISFLWANLIQAALFATLHMAGFLWLFFFAMGYVSGRMTRAAGGLLPAVALHMLNNGSTIALLWYLDQSAA